MLENRRNFLQTTAAAALAVSGAPLPAQTQSPAPNPIDAIPDSEVVAPKIKFGGVEISRIILGANPLHGFSHNNGNFGASMREWYTQERVIEVMRRCDKFGINAFNYVHMGRGQADWDRYLAEGGKMRLIAQATTKDPAELVKAVHPWAAWVQGEITDRSWRAGQLNTTRDYAKKLRDLGVTMVGVASHIPEVLYTIESQGWDVDFYAGSAYNIRRTPDELRKLLGGELPEMPGDVYLQEDPSRMYRFFRSTKKPCIAYKILAAGRVGSPTQAFQRAFESMKPIDLVCVGVFPRVKDEVKEDAWYSSRFGSGRG
jgi:hypothetical protein